MLVRSCSTEHCESYCTMPALKIHPENENAIHFLTFTTIEWIDIFTNPNYFYLLSSSLKYCQDNFGLKIYGYVFMTNHLHFLWQAKEGYKLSRIVQSYKRFTTEKLKSLIKKDHRKYIAGLIKTSFFKKTNNNFQVWQENNYPEYVETEKFFYTKLDYIHLNPVRKEYVENPIDWFYSSTRFYETGDIMPLKIDLIET